MVATGEEELALAHIINLTHYHATKHKDRMHTVKAPAPNRSMNRSGSLRTARLNHQLSSSARGTSSDPLQPKLTLLTEFRQIVQYTRTKRKSRSNSSKSLTTAAAADTDASTSSANPNEPKVEEVSSVGKRASHAALTLHSNLKASTFGRNVDYLQERSREFSERRTLKKRKAPLQRSVSDPSLLLVVEPQANFGGGRLTRQNSSGSLRDKQEEDDGSTRFSVASMRNSFAESIFARNIDYLQEKSEELSRTVHGTMLGRNSLYEAEQDPAQSYARSGSNVSEESALSWSVDYLQEMSLELSRQVAGSIIFEETTSREPSTHGGSVEESTFSKNVDYLQEQAEELTKSLAETAAAMTTEEEEDETTDAPPRQSTVSAAAAAAMEQNYFAQNVDYLQEQAEELSRNVADTITSWFTWD